MTTQTYIHRGQQVFVRWIGEIRQHWAFQGIACCLGGFLLSAASLGNRPLPLTMGLISTLEGWQAALAAAGSVLGSGLFWGSAGYQGMIWAVLALGLALTLGKITQADGGLLLSAVGCFSVAATGLLFQMRFQENTAFSIYLARIILAGGSAWCFRRAVRREEPVYTWLAEGAAVLALSQVAPLPWLSAGYLAAGVLAGMESLPGVAVVGLALDLAGVTQISMTAVLCMASLARLVPARGKWLRCLAPTLCYVVVMTMSNRVDLMPLPGLAVGGLLGLILPGRQEVRPRRGETGMAQVRLEVMAGVLDQTRQLLLDTREQEPDVAALLDKTRLFACGACSHRKQCQNVRLPGELLEQAESGQPLPFPCKRPSRMLLELRRSREQLRSIRGERARREQYRLATAQQYGFLSEFLRQQADELPRREERLARRFQAEVGFSSAGHEVSNGDRCMWFAGTRCRYYILLCDGMGTGPGAEREGRTGAEMLRQMLTAGFPAEYALRSVNSLCCLRQMAGAVTVDLAEICLDSGKVTLYKWGAAPSWVLRRAGAEKIGTVGPPPGLSVSQQRETVVRLSLRRGEALILASDGVNGEDVLHRLRIDPAEPPGELAALLVEHGTAQGSDDATVAVIRLRPTTMVVS